MTNAAGSSMVPGVFGKNGGLAMGQDEKAKHTDEFYKALEHWDELHQRNEQLEAENSRQQSELAMLSHRIHWLEQELISQTAKADRYKAANVEVATELKTVATVFMNAVKKVNDVEHAPQTTIMPMHLRGDVRLDEEETIKVREIAERFRPRIAAGDG